MLSNKIKYTLIGIFSAIELAFLVLLLTLGGQASVIISFISIVLAFGFSIIFLNFKNKNFFIQLALFFTVGADICLVLCQPIQQSVGMLFFSFAQLVYFCKLLYETPSKKVRLANLISRCVAIVLVQALTLIVVGAKADFLALISMFYYTNLILNIVFAFFNFKQNPYFAIGMVLFALCDTIIGLNVAIGTYIYVPETSFLYQLAFSPFNWAWLFYLPSQTLISISSTKAASK